MDGLCKDDEALAIEMITGQYLNKNFWKFRKYNKTLISLNFYHEKSNHLNNIYN